MYFEGYVTPWFEFDFAAVTYGVETVCSAAFAFVVVVVVLCYLLFQLERYFV